jgi:hypothetical protein
LFARTATNWQGAGPEHERRRARLGSIVGSGYTIRALDESSWDAFAELVEANNGVFGKARSN